MDWFLYERVKETSQIYMKCYGHWNKILPETTKYSTN